MNNKPVNVNLKDAMSNNVSVVTSVAQDSNSSTSSIQKISSDSGPSSDLNSPLDPSSVTLKSDSS